MTSQEIQQDRCKKMEMGGRDKIHKSQIDGERETDSQENRHTGRQTERQRKQRQIERLADYR
jgi:hypothetical protein